VTGRTCLSGSTLANREFCRRLKLLILLRAFERSGVAFCKTFGFIPSGPAKAVQNRFAVLSLVSFFWRSKRKILAIGETYATRALQKNTNGVMPKRPI
jgi:hypothetical protein